jgi:cytoskeletal protein CcmA (bactofilin family)
VKGMSEMTKTRSRTDGTARDVGDVVSIIGPGMKVVGDCSSDGTIRVEGQVEGSVKAAKSVVIGKEGVVVGDVVTQDAIVAGRVNGSVSAESRVELQASCRVEGDIRSRRIKLDEGGQVDGQLHMGGQGADRSAGAQKHGEKPAHGAPEAVQIN